MARKKAIMENEVKNRFNLNDTVDRVKDTVKNVNNFVLETSEDLVEGTITRAAQWQEVGDKALKGGLKLTKTQQNIVFDALETIKDQVVDSRKRFKAIFN